MTLRKPAIDAGFFVEPSGESHLVPVDGKNDLIAAVRSASVAARNLPRVQLPSDGRLGVGCRQAWGRLRNDGFCT